MTGDTIVYYRSRPSEPEASGLAMRLQREAVQKEVQGGSEVMAEFIEREGEPGSETYPAYVAARRVACNAGRSVMFIIASRAAIGSGDVFKEPDQPASDLGDTQQPARDGLSWMVLNVELFTPSVPAAPEIMLPEGAPGPLCLYADCRPRQFDTLIYLCNAGPDALAEVVATTHTVNWYEHLSSKRRKVRWAEGHRFEQRWGVIPPGTGVLVASLHYWDVDYASRHRLAYTDSAGRRRKAEAHDMALNLSHAPEPPWAAYRAIP